MHNTIQTGSGIYREVANVWFNVSDIGENPLICTHVDCASAHRPYWGTTQTLNTIGDQACAHIPLREDQETGITYAYVDSVRPCRCGCMTLMLKPSTADPIVSDVHTAACAYCQNFIPASLAEYFYPENGYRFAYCPNCFPTQVTECAGCQDQEHVSDMSTVRLSNQNTYYSHLCGDCYTDYNECEHCGLWTHRDEDDCCPEEGTDDCSCGDCRRRARDRDRVIRNYSYKPSPAFRAVGPEKRMRTHPVYGHEFDASAYMGFELEVEVNREFSRGTVAAEIQSGLGDVVYLKEDGSINNGFEIVTHPMTLDYAMTEFKWRVLRDSRRAEKIRSSDNCGLHVHVSRAAFSGAAHDFRWLMFWHRNQSAMIQLAGRDSSYARYHSSQRAHLFRAAQGKPVDMARYSAINTNNEATYEVRVFASTVYINRLKASLQLVDATVEYTRQLAAAKVMRDGGFAWSEFVVWLRGHAARYPDLLIRIREVVRVDNAAPVKVNSELSRIDKNGYVYGREYADIVIQERAAV